MLQATLLLGTLGLASSFSPAGHILQSARGSPLQPRKAHAVAVGHSCRGTRVLRASAETFAEPFEPGEAARGLRRPAGGADRYSWSQDAKQVLVSVPCSPDTTGKNVQCNIKPSTLSLSVSGEKVFEEEPLAFKVKPVRLCEIAGRAAEEQPIK